MTLVAQERRTDNADADLEERLRPPALPPPNEWRTIRKAADVTIEAVASAVGVDVMTVSRWERGLNYPWRKHRAAYAQVLLALTRIAAARPSTPNAQK